MKKPQCRQPQLLNHRVIVIVVRFECKTWMPKHLLCISKAYLCECRLVAVALPIETAISNNLCTERFDRARASTAVWPAYNILKKMGKDTPSLDTPYGSTRFRAVCLFCRCHAPTAKLCAFEHTSHLCSLLCWKEKDFSFVKLSAGRLTCNNRFSSAGYLFHSLVFLVCMPAVLSLLKDRSDWGHWDKRPSSCTGLVWRMMNCAVTFSSSSLLLAESLE